MNDSPHLRSSARPTARRPLHLRTVLALILAAFVLIASGTAAALVLITSDMRHAAAELGAAVESVRVAEHLQVELLSYSRASNRYLLSNHQSFATERAQHEENLLSDLHEVRRYVGSLEEARVLEEVEQKLHAYLTQRRAAEARGLGPEEVMDETDAAFDEASATLGAFVAINTAQARRDHERAEQWDHRANLAALMAACLMLVSTGAVLLGARRNVVEPLLAIREAIGRFGRDGSTRAPEVGPAELRDIARSFNDMAELLEDRRKAQLAFLGGVAHDLKNPLSALRMSVGLFAPDKQLPPEPRARRIMELVGRQVDHLDRMIGDLVDTSRIEAGKLELRFAERDLRDFARETVELYRPVSSIHEVVLALPDEPLRVRCDATRIAQVLNNLVSNAIKYSPAGGRVEVSARRDGDFAVVLVRDEGMGIAPQDAERIFEPFRRAGAQAHAIPGVGLGLSVARRIAEAHGGRIDVESRPGHGSVFRLSLPLAEVNLAAAS